MFKKLRLTDGMDINAYRQADLSKEFESNLGARVLIFMGSYPFLIIGTIQDILNDLILINTEVTNISELDDELFWIHIDEIEVFFIENEQHNIPKLKEDFC